MYLYFVMVVMSLILFNTLVFKYFLVVLIIMELVISNLSMMMLWAFSSKTSGGVFLYYLVFSVCESVMELAVLVLGIRYYGGDYYKSISSGKI